MALGYWGWSLFDTVLRIVPAVALPLLAGTAWGVFAVPNDKSRSGKTVIAVPGSVRLVLEIGLFVFSTGAIYDSLSPLWAVAFAGIVIAHYVASYDRVKWLLQQT